MMYLFQHQARPEFVYSHRWSADMLLMWDNRCLIHAATGGYEGHRRLLHRITIAERR
jgi:taurine dioxygenase